MELKDIEENALRKKEKRIRLSFDENHYKGSKPQNDIEIKFKLKKVSFQNDQNLETNENMTSIFVFKFKIQI